MIHCPRCNTPVQSGSTHCPGCEFAFHPPEEPDYTKIITVCFLLFVLLPALASIFISVTREKPPISSSAENSSLDPNHEPTKPSPPKEFTVTIPTPEGGDLVKEVVVTKKTLTWITSFPSDTMAFVVFENRLPADTSKIGIIPRSLFVDEPNEFSTKGEIFYNHHSPISGKAYACLFVVDNKAWGQPEPARKIIHKAKDQLPCIEEISDEWADAVIQKVRWAEFPPSIQDKLDPVLYREILVGYRLAIIKEVEVPF